MARAARRSVEEVIGIRLSFAQANHETVSSSKAVRGLLHQRSLRQKETD